MPLPPFSYLSYENGADFKQAGAALYYVSANRLKRAPSALAAGHVIGRHAEHSRQDLVGMFTQKRRTFPPSREKPTI